jgi:hypothetical protein
MAFPLIFKYGPPRQSALSEGFDSLVRGAFRCQEFRAASVGRALTLTNINRLEHRFLGSGRLDFKLTELNFSVK